MSLTVEEVNHDVPYEEAISKLTVKLSKGASVTPMEDVTIYTSIQHLIFTLPGVF